MERSGKRNVIIVTDGDGCAKRSVEIAAHNIGGRCISRSAGNPTMISGSEFIKHIKNAAYDPVVVMVDDKGNTHKGFGEMAMEFLIKNRELNVLGVIAVASNTKDVKGIAVDFSIDKNLNVVESAVDKNGDVKDNRIIKGDTVDILNQINVPIIVGIGDPGKIDGVDKKEIGAPIVTKALEKILEFNNYKK